MLLTLLFLLCSPDYEVSPCDKRGVYTLKIRSLGDADDILGLNPNKQYPAGKDVNHLTGEKRKSALNAIRQRKYQRQRNFKVRW